MSTEPEVRALPPTEGKDASALVQEELVQQTRDRTTRGLEDRELTGEVIAAGAFLVVAIGMALLLDAGRPFEADTAALLFCGFVLAAAIKFEVGAGYTNPTNLIFVPMLFLLPATIVPLLIAAAFIVSQLPEYLRRKRHPQRMIVDIADSWYAIGPALIVVLAGIQAPELGDWQVLLLALAAQFALDLGISALREWYELGVSPRTQIADAGWYLAVDGLLASIGLGVASASIENPLIFLLLPPLLALLLVFAHQRRSGLESALELSAAYRGTTILLADVIEHDDNYTGSHSKGVVSLSVKVAREMGLDPHQLRNVEFAALLHDVGKLAISKDIINKDGPLSSEEWALIRLHTVDGEQMLRTIGGLFDDVAEIVRASHERWDGSGYPDGLAGVRIPLEARIVSCCDAFDAMTTDRSYRPAMTTVEALEELRAHSGEQFDPGVAWTVIRLVEESERRRFDPLLAAASAQSHPAGTMPDVEASEFVGSRRRFAPDPAMRDEGAGLGDEHRTGAAGALGPPGR